MRRELVTLPIDDLIDDLLTATDTWHPDPIDDDIQWKLTVENCDTDFFLEINDADCYGEVEQTPYNDGYYERPWNFDGKARIVHKDRWGVIWWQPRPDIWGTPKPWGNFDADFKVVKYLYENGWASAVLYKRTTLPCGHEEETVSALGGIDVWPWDDEHDYWKEIVSDLINELEDE